MVVFPDTTGILQQWLFMRNLVEVAGGVAHGPGMGRGVTYVITTPTAAAVGQHGGILHMELLDTTSTLAYSLPRH